MVPPVINDKLIITKRKVIPNFLFIYIELEPFTVFIQDNLKVGISGVRGQIIN